MPCIIRLDLSHSRDSNSHFEENYLFIFQMALSTALDNDFFIIDLTKYCGHAINYMDIMSIT